MAPANLSPAARRLPLAGFAWSTGDNLLRLCLALGFLQGTILNLLPLTFKVFQQLFGANYEMQGRTEALYFAGAILGNLIGGYGVARLAVRPSSRIAMILAGSGCLCLAASRSFLLVQAASVLMGVGGSWLSITANTIVARHYAGMRQRVIAGVTLSTSIGGLLAPFLLGRYVHYGWQQRGWLWWIPFATLTGVFFGLACLLPTAVEPSPPPPEDEERSISWLCLLRVPALWMISLLMVLHGLGQMGATVWLARLHESRLHLSESQVGTMISTNFVGVILGRALITTFLAGRMADRRLLGCSATIGCVSYLLVILSARFDTALVWMFFAGLGMCGDMVALTSFTASVFRQDAPKAFGVTQAVGQTGAALGPYIIGFWGTRSGSLEHAVWMIPATICVIAATAFAWERIDGRPPQRLKSAAREA